MISFICITFLIFLIFHYFFMYNVSDRIMTYAELLGNK
nr:MAG TPA: hypothetical protein [Caudoviricetes sp.]